MLNKIIQNLKTGNYRIEYQEHCDCRFDWRLERGELICEAVDTDGFCWVNNVLIMDDLAGKCDDTVNVGNAGVIAAYDAEFGLNVPMFNISYSTEQEIVKAIKDSDAHEKLTDGIYSPDANNDLHDKRNRDALVKWLKWHIDNRHLQTYVYYPRDFANEYVCVLVALPHYFYRDDYLYIPAHWYTKTATEWAEMYLRKDTDGTRYDIGFELIDELYEIDYCWYDRRAGTTVSHDTERYYFVDLQAAENFLDTLGPEGVNCYELNKLSVDYDGEIMEIDYITIKWETKVEK